MRSGGPRWRALAQRRRPRRRASAAPSPPLPHHPPCPLCDRVCLSHRQRRGARRDRRGRGDGCDRRLRDRRGRGAARGRGAGKGACVERTRLEWAGGAGRYYARRLARARARARHSAHLAQQSTDRQPALTGAHAVVPTSFKVRRRGAVVGSRRALARGPRRARPPGAARVRCALAQCAHAGAPFAREPRTHSANGARRR